MKAEIVKDVFNPLLKRREINFRLIFDGAQPSRDETKRVLSATFDLDPDLLIIERMRAEFGKREATGYAKVYETKDALLTTERKHILRRNNQITEEKEE